MSNNLNKTIILTLSEKRIESFLRKLRRKPIESDFSSELNVLTSFRTSFEFLGDYEYSQRSQTKSYATKHIY